MDTPEFPPNSDASKRTPPDKDIQRVTSGDVTRKKKSLRKQFTETFIEGSVQGSVRYSIFDVVLPMARDMIWEAVSEGFRNLIFGDSRRGRGGSTRPQTGPTGYMDYSRFSGGRMSSSQRTMSRLARSQHDFDDIVLDSRVEAEEVIDKLFEVVSRYGGASVADLYELVGLSSAHTDQKWGWTDVRGAGVTRIRGGYLLDLPDPEPLTGNY
jgi:hypothetical protein